MQHYLCLVCGADFKFEEVPNCCPGCGDSQSIPADLNNNVTVTISKHELRILTMWAYNWAHDKGFTSVVQIILDRLGTQTDTPLTLQQEISDLRAQFGEVTVYDHDGNVVDI